MIRRYAAYAALPDREIQFSWARDHVQVRVTSAVWEAVARGIDDPELAEAAMKNARAEWIDCPNDPWTRYQLEVSA